MSQKKSIVKGQVKTAKNTAELWESGDLGRDERFVRAASKKVADQIDDALDFIKSIGLNGAEINSGGFLPALHLPINDIMTSDAKRDEYLDKFTSRGIKLTALNCNGNPLNPNKSVGERQSQDVIDSRIAHEWEKIRKECEPEVLKMFGDVVEQEKIWAKYLFKDGSIIGLNEQLLSEYVDWIAHKRMTAIGLPPLTKGGSNPLPWTQKWIAGAEVQVAPQETEISSYVVGGTKQDVTTDTFKGFTL